MKILISTLPVMFLFPLASLLNIFAILNIRS